MVKLETFSYQPNNSISVLADSIKGLAMTERVETIMPLTYMCLITMAYLSPNAGIIGGIKLDLWHYSSISDFEGFIQNLSLLFAIDLLSFIVNAGLLWKYCQINLMKSLQKLQNDFWFLMLVVESTLFLEVNNT